MSLGRIGPPAASTVATEIDGRISLFNPDTDRVLMLNETASDIWRLADGEHSLDDLNALLAQAYGVDAGSIRAEVEEAITVLREEGFFQTDAG